MDSKVATATSQPISVPVSVIVPVYNTGAHLKKCLESVMAQTFSDYELLVIDDGSTDGSGTLCDLLAECDARIRVVHQQNQGRAAVRNNGVDMAKGEYILFVDSDDFIEPEMLSQLMSGARRENADIVMCRYRTMDPNFNVLSVMGVNSQVVLSNLDATTKIVEDKEIRSYLWNKLIRRMLFFGTRFPLNRNYEDMAIAYRLMAKANRVACIPYVGYNYVRHPESITKTPRHTTKWIENQVDVINVWCERLDFVKADAQLQHLGAFCAGKAYQKCLRLLDTCSRHGVYIPQCLLHEILECMDYLKRADLQHLPWKLKCNILIVRCRMTAFRILREIMTFCPRKSTLSVAWAKVRI